MSKKKISYKKLIEINSVLTVVIDTSKRDRLSLYINEFVDNIKSTMELYNKEVSKFNRELCSVDSDGNLYLDSKNNPIFTKFTKENNKKREEKLEELMEKEVEIETVDCKDTKRIQTLHISVITLLNGYLFDLTKEQIEEMYIEIEPATPILNNN